jgi:predicted NUDIX family phosphoesterase
MPVEQVLVVPTSEFHTIGVFQGFSAEVANYFVPLTQSDACSFKARPAMEGDPSFKQLIPYVVVEYQKPDGGTQLFRYVRGSGQGEARLHEKWSIGVGGHVNPCDGVDSHDAYARGVVRELNEELVLPEDYVMSPVGLVNDDSNEVGSVHLGIVHRLVVKTDQVSAREEELVAAGFVDVEEIRVNIDKLETWSRLCLEALYPAN